MEVAGPDRDPTLSRGSGGVVREGGGLVLPVAVLLGDGRWLFGAGHFDRLVEVSGVAPGPALVVAIGELGGHEAGSARAVDAGVGHPQPAGDGVPLHVGIVVSVDGFVGEGDDPRELAFAHDAVRRRRCRVGRLASVGIGATRIVLARVEGCAAVDAGVRNGAVVAARECEREERKEGEAGHGSVHGALVRGKFAVHVRRVRNSGDRGGSRRRSGARGCGRRPRVGASRGA